MLARHPDELKIGRSGRAQWIHSVKTVIDVTSI